MYENYCKLKELRNVKDADVVKATGITKSTFSDWKSGRSVPKPDKLRKIADYFGVSVDYLMTGVESQGYYLNEETAKMAQEMFEDADMRSLFDMKRKMPPERFQAHMEFMKNLYRNEFGEDI
jgi:transcriptional regulator with XRE-family HTH domain